MVVYSYPRVKPYRGGVPIQINKPFFNLKNGAIGALRGYGQQIIGYMDELRFSKVARYTTSYTVPTGPFPDQ